MPKQLLHNIKIIVSGILMGFSGIIPGLSSRTIAVITGIYPKLITAFNQLTTRKSNKWEAARFLILIGASIVIGTYIFASIMNALIERFPGHMYLFFTGLIIGTAPLLIRQIKKIDSHTKFSFTYLIPLFIAFILVYSMNLNQPSSTILITNISLSIIIALFFAGFISASTGLFPGISGSVVLLSIGMYSTMIHAITHLNWVLLIALAFGAFAGVIVCSRMIHFLLAKYPGYSCYAIIGFILASAINIFPQHLSLDNVLLMIVYTTLFILGFIIAFILGGDQKHVQNNNI